MRLLIAALPLLLASCAAYTPDEQLARQRVAQVAESTRPTCEGETDCKAKWEAAQLWVVKNSAYKIQIATPVLIETYRGSVPDQGHSVRVTKEALGQGRYRIVARVWCANSYKCRPDEVGAVVSFNAAVSGAKP